MELVLFLVITDKGIKVEICIFLFHYKSQSMKTMKKLLLAGIGLLFFACNPNGQSQSAAGKEFQLISAQQYNWYGGAPGMHGTNYVIKADLKNREDYKFQELCLGNEALPLSASLKEGHWEIKGRKAIHEEPGDLKEQKTENKMKGCEHHLSDDVAKGNPVLFFTYKGKSRYVVLDQLEKGPDQHYQ